MSRPGTGAFGGESNWDDMDMKLPARRLGDLTTSALGLGCMGR